MRQNQIFHVMCYNLHELNNLTDQIHVHRQRTYQILTELLKKTQKDFSPYEKIIFWNDIKMYRWNVKEIGQEIQELKANVKRKTELLRIDLYC